MQACLTESTACGQARVRMGRYARAPADGVDRIVNSAAIYAIIAVIRPGP